MVVGSRGVTNLDELVAVHNVRSRPAQELPTRRCDGGGVCDGVHSQLVEKVEELEGQVRRFFLRTPCGHRGWVSGLGIRRTGYSDWVSGSPAQVLCAPVSRNQPLIGGWASWHAMLLSAEKEEQSRREARETGRGTEQIVIARGMNDVMGGGMTE